VRAMTAKLTQDEPTSGLLTALASVEESLRSFGIEPFAWERLSDEVKSSDAQIVALQQRVAALNNQIAMVMGLSRGLNSFLEESHSNDGYFVTLTRDSYDHLRDILKLISETLDTTRWDGK